MVDLLNENLLKKGFQEEVVTGAPKCVSFPYIESLTGYLTHIKSHLNARILFYYQLRKHEKYNKKT